MESVSSFQKVDIILKAGMYEYLLVANPDETIGRAASAEKQFFFDQYQEKIAVKTKPHITVANFLAREEMEETICRWIQRISSQQKSFEVTLNNFSAFPPHTIYIRVQNHQPFQSLCRQLKVIDNYVRSNDCPPARLITHPHLTIARRLPADVYHKAVMEYSRRFFNGSFIVNELILLRRRNQFDSCEKINVFHFLPEVEKTAGYEQLSIL